MSFSVFVIASFVYILLLFFIAFYTDKKAGPHVRSAAQGLITLATYGVGMYIGFYMAGKIVDKYLLADGTHNWHAIWLIPCVFAAAIALLFMLLFKNEKTKTAAA